jgi:hypothetical protein
MFTVTLSLPLCGASRYSHTAQVVNNKNRQQQEVAVDDANVGGSSRVDVSHTRLYVALR